MSVAGGQIITAADMNRALRGGPERPFCVVRNTVVTSVTNNSVATALPWDTETRDTHGWHDNVTNNSRITPNIPGWVEVKSIIHFAGNATGRRSAVLKLNAGTAYYGEIKAATSASGVSAINVREFEVNGSTDYLQTFAFQDSGGALNTADIVATYFSVTWLRES